MTPEKPTKGIRLASMLVDHFAMTFIIVANSFIIGATLYFSVNHQATTVSFLNNGIIGAVSIVLFSIYFNKDIFRAQSIAKRILKLQVVDNLTGDLASPLQCLVRNITIIIWPIEVIVTLFNPARRLGDRIAKTRVAYFNRELPREKLNWKKITFAALMGLVVMAFVFLLLICLQLGGIL